MYVAVDEFFHGEFTTPVTVTITTPAVDEESEPVIETRSLTGIFDNEYDMVTPGTFNIGSGQPELLIKASDYAGIPDEAIWTIGDVNYKVDHPEDDGTGLINLILTKV